MGIMRRQEISPDWVTCGAVMGACEWECREVPQVLVLEFMGMMQQEGGVLATPLFALLSQNIRPLDIQQLHVMPHTAT